PGALPRGPALDRAAGDPRSAGAVGADLAARRRGGGERRDGAARLAVGATVPGRLGHAPRAAGRPAGLSDPEPGRGPRGGGGGPAPAGRAEAGGGGNGP